MSNGDELAAQILGADAAGRDPKAVRRLSALGLTEGHEVWITRQTSDIHKVGVRQVLPGQRARALGKVVPGFYDVRVWVRGEERWECGPGLLQAFARAHDRGYAVERTIRVVWIRGGSHKAGCAGTAWGVGQGGHGCHAAARALLRVLEGRQAVRVRWSVCSSRVSDKTLVGLAGRISEGGLMVDPRSRTGRVRVVIGHADLRGWSGMQRVSAVVCADKYHRVAVCYPGVVPRQGRGLQLCSGAHSLQGSLLPDLPLGPASSTGLSPVHMWVTVRIHGPKQHQHYKGSGHTLTAGRTLAACCRCSSSARRSTRASSARCTWSRTPTPARSSRASRSASASSPAQTPSATSAAR